MMETHTFGKTLFGYLNNVRRKKNLHLNLGMPFFLGELFNTRNFHPCAHHQNQQLIYLMATYTSRCFCKSTNL